MRLVMKFGGGLLSSREEIGSSARLVDERLREGDEVIVVVSALRGVTDGIIDAMDSQEKDVEIENFCSSLRALHLSAAREAGCREMKGIVGLVDGLIRMLEGDLKSYRQGDKSARMRALISSTGERLSAPVFSHHLNCMGRAAKHLTGGEAGIITDSGFENASPRMDACRGLLHRRLGDLLDRGIVPVVTGFIAENDRGEMTTLGRGGSDYTTSIIGNCLKADEIWIWKDVCGIMTANPKVVREARTIPLLSYSEAAELAHFGAKVLHPRTMEPAMEGMIPIRVKDATRPGLDGTLISSSSSEIRGSVKAVTSIDGVSLVSISGTGMAGVPGMAARVFDSIARGNANVMMISQSSSETNITIIIPQSDLEVCRASLGEEFEGDDAVREIHFDEDVSIVSVVGSGMKGTPGVAARVFKAVSGAGVNVIMIAQGSSEVNISFVVGQGYAERAVASIHREFRLGELFGQGPS